MGRARIGTKKPAKKRGRVTLSSKGQKLLASAKAKIALIKKDFGRSKGLTPREADVAAQMGLIDGDQIFWWLEGWQKGERKVARRGTLRSIVHSSLRVYQIKGYPGVWQGGLSEYSVTFERVRSAAKREIYRLRRIAPTPIVYEYSRLQ